MNPTGTHPLADTVPRTDHTPQPTRARAATPSPSRLLAGWSAGGRADDLTTHRRRYGPLPHLTADELVDLVHAAGLRGRGGAGFPTSVKLRAVADRRRRPVVVANGCEGEPASCKDAALLDCAPHLVLDGIELVARTLGAESAILAIHDGPDGPGPRLRTLAAQRQGPVPVRVRGVPARYVASEETALVNFLSGGPATPTTSPPRPTDRGVGGAPTLVDNIETLAHIALIARNGAPWFRELGTPDLPGTLLVSIDGAVHTPGVVEVAAGTTVRAAIELCGGPSGHVQAVLSGGYGGAWLPATAIETPLTHTAMRAAGAALGVPTLLPLPSGACGLAHTARLVRFLADQSAGQCGPCLFGLPAVAADLAAIAAGSRDARHAHDRLRHRLDLVTGRGACALPDGAARLTRTALDVFSADLRDHLTGRPCLAAGAPMIFPLEFR